MNTPLSRMPMNSRPEGTFMNDNVIDETELARLGIKRVQSDYFVWGDFKYGNARDALAAARRGEKK